MILARCSRRMGSARVSRAGFGVPRKQSFQKSPQWRERHRQYARSEPDWRCMRDREIFE
jgi:hypothetical protein